MPFVQNPVPTYSESQMSTMLPATGGLNFFYNSDKENALYSVDSLGNFAFVSDGKGDDDCCTCCLADNWMSALTEALTDGQITADEFNTAVATGFYATSTNDGNGNCTIFVGTNFSRLTAITIAPRPTTLAIGANVQLAVVPTPANADARVLWVSSNTDKATVSSSGLVHGVAAATVTIHAYSLVDATITDSISIVVS